MLHKCLNKSIPTGNLYSGGLGAYYLLVEQSRYHLLLLELQQHNQQPERNKIHHHHSSSAAPLRCKKLLKQALEGAKSATDRFKKSNFSNLSNQRSNISLLGGEWIGSHALLAVCYRRLEDFAKMQEQSGADHSIRGPNVDSGVASIISSPAGRNGNGFSKRGTISSGASVVSTGGASIVSNATIATLNPRPRSQRVVDKILHRLEKQHRASTEEDDNLTYYTLNSNYTSNTLSSLVVPTVWNQDVLGGRAGALQAIWWLRNEFGDPTLGQELVVSMAVRILIEGLSTAASIGLNNHDKADVDDDSTWNSNADSCYSYCESDILFWVCDSQGSHRAYLGASRGVVGILHTLLGLSDKDWKLVEEQTPNARGCVRNTIDAFLSSSNNGNQEASVLENNSVQTDNLFRDRFLFDGSGNLRPRLDASEESDTTVDWFHGATGLAMLLLEASKVFHCKQYLQEAHRLCDVVIFPRGLAEQQKKSQRSNSSFRSRRAVDAPNKKGPVGLAGMAICFLQLSKLCSDEQNDEETNEQTTNRISLRGVWKTRAALYAKHAHQEWINYLKVIPTANGTGNAYSLYEGMGGVISLLWQLSLSTFPNAQSNNDNLVVHMPLYGLGLDDSCNNTIPEENNSEPILLSHGDVTLTETSLHEPRSKKSPQKSGRTSSKEALAFAEARKRRAAAEAEARKRQAQEAEEAKRAKEEKERAIKAAKRKAQLEARKKAQLLARKKALEVAEQNEEEESRNKAAEEKSKREALLLARKQAKERVEARRRAKEAEEAAKARAEEQRKADQAESKRRLAEEEKKKRKALAAARLKRRQTEAEVAKQREEERKIQEETDRRKRAQDLQEKEKQRKKRLEELKLRQQRAAEIAKEKQKQKLLLEEEDTERRDKELTMKEAERKRQDAERRRRLAILRERKKKEEERLKAEQDRLAAKQKAAARKALERKKLQLREERLAKKKELEDERLRKQLQQALDKEAEKQRHEEQLQREAERELKMQEAMNAINAINQFDSNPVYSPSFGERKKTLNPAHFSAQTKSSLFWSLQTDSNIGSSENYKPALVAADSTPSSAAMSTTLEEPS